MKKNGGVILKDKLGETSELPRDVILGVPILTLTGHSEIIIENYRSILEYTDKLVRIQTKTGQIRISGKELKIDYYRADDMQIFGRINVIELK